ncbi:GNAT family N-acetyltransferase (plasmid) [Deinococcus taeanensis]|uniref:GNAT family N-acetyltransferase n=1 Tax=Deinococcus taeanensis TaxID=2737050 RepID=UPI001CDD8407|nr:GNAT family N-acetyltransferase [Deinococcus taeanensis]UBV44693.1 GNAT family N-acetyltransferase [Deinococcus taeanensis]
MGEQDVPRNPTTSSTPLDLQAFREVVRREEVVFVVRRGEALVALTRLTLPRGKGLQEAGAVSNDLTTTHAAHRARGLATLVKAHALRWAQHEGYVRAGTGGTVLNLPMLRVNTRLGYRTEPMWVTWERRLD